MNQEIQNICSNISNPKANDITANQIVMNGPFQLSALKISQMQGLRTSVIGQEYYCTDCTTDSVCVSTATSKVGSFAEVGARTTVCN